MTRIQVKGNAQLPNVSADWKGSSRFERRFLQELLKREATAKAIIYFAKHCKKLGDYCYWFTLGTLWISYTGWSELNLWKKLFSSDRPNRLTSLMKPDEYRLFQSMPEQIKVYRAHRPGETDWVAYTFDPQAAAKFALQREVSEIVEYLVPKTEILALFLRRGEKEILVLDRSKVQQLRVLQVRTR